MNSPQNARTGYAAAAAPVRTSRGTEYAAFARVTGRLKSVDPQNKSAFAELAHAVHDNSRLWGLLAADLFHDNNSLPIELRAQLISLSEFVRRHSLGILAGRGDLEPLIDINTSIMRGLRGEVEEAA